MGNHVSGKRLGGLVVVGERGCDLRSIDEEDDEEQGSGEEDRPPKVLKRGTKQDFRRKKKINF